ncbi:MAG TPA: hypothetical protein VIC85_03120 [Ktedonobacterales bacterium]|jgi:hypothetical protein
MADQGQTQPYSPARPAVPAPPARSPVPAANTASSAATSAASSATPGGGSVSGGGSVRDPHRSTGDQRPIAAADVLTIPDPWDDTAPSADAWTASAAVSGAAVSGRPGADPAALGTFVGARHAGYAGGASPEAHMRVRARQQIREFLRAVPRREEHATLALIRPDGTLRLLTRAQLSAAIDHLRPRQRQIMRLAIEERWPRQRVCEYLRHISLKTFERDQVEALDLLALL